MKYPMNKYKFIQHDNEIIAISSYAGKKVKGISKCHENDEFNIEKGKELAAARCHHKVAVKRSKRAEQKMREAEKELIKAKKHYEKMVRYCSDATDAEFDAEETIKKLLSKF